ncbi:MAG: hypothetical protein JWQ04_2988 [Pedosphaera sp.]|nr:hypothetical protein [Pedosphaera sp.]
MRRNCGLRMRADFVAQIFNLLYRRLAVGKAFAGQESFQFRGVRRFQICDTADCKSALRIWRRNLLSLGVSFIAGLARGQGHELPPLEPPHGELLPSFWELHGWQVVLAAVVMIGIVALTVGWLRRPRQVVLEPPGIAARRALESRRNRAEDGQLVAEVSRVLKHYVMTAFHFPPQELTTTEFRKTLQSHPEIKPELAEVTADFLRRCDQWKFSPAPPTPKLGAVAGALELVDKLESSRAPADGKQ